MPEQPGAEELIWQGGPSHIINWKLYAVCLLLSPLVVPLFIAAWTWLATRNHRYVLTTERLQLRTGVLNKRTDDLELYRIRDIVVHEPFFYRLFGAGNVVMETSDRTHPTFTLEAIRDPHAVTDDLRRQVELMRKIKHVREVDFE